MIKYINFLVLNWALSLAETDIEQDNKAKSKEDKIDFAVGGQAVIEGVMMRSPNNITIAVRKPNGEVKVKKNNYKTLTQRFKALNIPIIRGVINLFEMMVIGTKAINFSASIAMDERPEEEQKQKKSTLAKIGEGIMFGISLILALGLSIFLFKFIPLWSTTYLESNIPVIKQNYIIFNLIDGIIKMLMFLGYIFVLTRFPSFKRIFEYHGAEHKSIFTYENKKDLTVDNAKPESRFHPRCGTSFVLIVFAISILVYTFVPKQDNFWVNLGLRLAFLPVIAGISYEYLKMSAKYAKNTIVKGLIAPGLWFQRLTTAEPDRKQLEIGLRSLTDALKMEKNS